MDGLIVVHTIMDYLDPEVALVGSVKETTQVLDNIANEIGTQVQRGNRVYLLEHKGETSEPVIIYPGIQAHSPNMTRVPMNDHSTAYETQFLRVKELVMADEIDAVTIVGFEYNTCVMDILMLLSGNDGPDIQKKQYRKASRRMKWKKQKFEYTFNAKISAEIREDLTDKLFSED